MPEEKQNKQIRNAVDQLQQLPEGFVFNSQKVWTGLEQQLPGKRKKKPTWYYAAAIALLVAGTAYLTMFKNDKAKPVIETTTGLAVLPARNPAPSRVVHQKDIRHTQINSAHSPSKKKIGKSLPVIATVQKETGGTETKAILPVTSVEPTAAITPPTEHAATIETKKAPIAVTKPVPKKYKVIHLNELLQPPITTDPQSNLSRSEFKKMIQQQNEEKEISLPAENNTKQLFFFKIKPATTTTSIVEN